MAKSATTIYLDEDVREKAAALFEDLGLDLSTAINVFLRQSLYECAFPFVAHRDAPNEDTRAAMREAEHLLADPNTRKFDSMEELIEDLRN